jgi:flavin-dependent dehydrogenase
MKKYDVVVVGGGFAGVAAAIAAAREGSRVLLVEKGNALGGAAVNCLVNPFMPYTTKIDGVDTALSAGIFTRIFEALKQRNASQGRRFLEEELKFILLDMIQEAGVDLLFHAYLFSVKKNGEKIESLSFATKCGVTEVVADHFVDATGDAQIAYLAQTCLSMNFGDSIEYKSIEGTLTEGEQWIEFEADKDSALQTIIDVFYIPQ